MKKLFVAFLALAFIIPALCLAGRLQDAQRGVIAARNSSSSSSSSSSSGSAFEVVSYGIASHATGLVNDATPTIGSFEVTAGDNRVLVVWVVNYTSGTARTVSGVTFNGDAFTSYQSDAIGGWRLACLYLVAPDVGTYDINATLSGVPGDVAMYAAYITGADQTTPLDGWDSVTGTSDDVSLAVTSATGDLVIDAIFSYENFAMTVGAGQTQVLNQSYDTDYMRVAASTEPGAATVNIGWTWTGSYFTFHGATNVNPAP